MESLKAPKKYAAKVATFGHKHHQIITLSNQAF